MKLRSVNVGLPKEVTYMGKTVRTGIYKEAVEGRVRLRELNLDGDGQADLVGHGGIYKAVLAYSTENYDYWKRELRRDDLRFGQFGENFTVEGMPDDQVCVGDVFRVGNALVEVTQPRVPCSKLAMKMEMPAFLKLYMSAKRPGFYLRVLEEGDVGAGDAIERVKADPEKMTVQEIFHLLYLEKDKVEGARRALCIAALSPGWRGAFEEIVGAAAEGPKPEVDCGAGR